jgi:hypothetical protein
MLWHWGWAWDDFDAIFVMDGISSGAPAISVTGDTNFGTIPVGTPASEVITIWNKDALGNPGKGTLEITLPITIVGAEASAFTVTVQPTETSPGIVTLAPGASTTFTIQADADVVDTFSADISIVSNVAGSPTLVPISVIVAQTYANYVLNVVQPALWMRHQEVSGTTIADSSGNGRNGTLTLGAGALGQDGQSGINEAILADGSTTRIQIPSNAALKTAEFTLAFLCKPTSSGEGAIGAWFSYSDAGDTALRFSFSNNVLVFSVGATGAGLAQTNSTTVVTLNQWQWIFATLSADKLPRIYKGRLGVLTQFSYTTQTAWSGTQNGAAILNLLNNAAQSRSFAGLMDESIYIAGTPSLTVMQNLIDLRGV